MKMCKWCHRVWGDDEPSCKCGSEDLADINEDLMKDREMENTIPKQRDGSAEAEFYQFLMEKRNDKS